jgi:autotransporter-associated beta strand protein
MLAVCSLTAVAQQTYYWKVTPINGSWANSAKWDPNGVPGVNDTVIFTNWYVSGNQTVTNAGNLSVKGMRVLGSTRSHWYSWGTNNAPDILQIGADGFIHDFYGGMVYSGPTYNGLYVILAGTAPLIQAGTLYLGNTNNTFTGNLCVPAGGVYLPGDGAAGNPANKIRLGTNGTIGVLGTSGGGGVRVVLNRNIELLGNGGMFRSWGDSLIGVNGVISGPGTLVFAPGTGNTANTNVMNWLYASNTYAGGTIVASGAVCPALGSPTAMIFSTGDVRIVQSGAICILSSNNVGPDAKVLVATEVAGAGLQFFNDTMVNIDSNSFGVLSLVAPGTIINSRLSSTTEPLGNGQMWLGYWANQRFTGSSLAALVANDPTHTYKFWGGSGGGSFSVGNRRATSQLSDLDGLPHNVVVGKPGLWGEWMGYNLTIDDKNTYSGTTTVNRGSSLMAYSWNGGASSLGSTSAPVVLNGSSLKIYAYLNTGSMMNKGPLTIDGATTLILDANQAVDAGFSVNNVAHLTVSALNRQAGSTLGVYADENLLATKERLYFNGGLTPANGMVAPYFVNTRDNEFLDYGANGFQKTTAQVLTLAGAATTAIVHSPGEAVTGGGQTIYALRANGIMTGTASDTLTVSGGGVIFPGGVTHTCPFAFGGAEAVLYTVGNTVLNGTLTGSGGLTKWGAGSLTLNGNNSATLGGTLTVNQGIVSIANDNNLGSGTVMLNGGTLSLTTVGGVCSKDITLGMNGGYLLSGGAAGWRTFSGKLTGSGPLIVSAGNKMVLSGLGNDYTGGTLWAGGGRFQVAATSALGSGDVLVGFGGLVSQSHANQLDLQFLGDENLSESARLYIKHHGSIVKLGGPVSPRVGSLEGGGQVLLGKITDEWTQAGSTMLRVGTNNRDAEYFGIIEDGSPNYPCSVCKVGTGTWTLWGEHVYAGGTMVSNGTLVVNNRLYTNSWVKVCGPGVLDGIGTVGVVSNLGGTVKGNLYMRRLVMDAAATNAVTLNGPTAFSQYNQLNVCEGVTLAGTLKLTLGFVPAIGQSFMIVNNTSAPLITTQFACGTGTTATYGGRTYYFGINYQGGDGNDIVLTRLVTGTVVTIR